MNDLSTPSYLGQTGQTGQTSQPPSPVDNPSVILDNPISASVVLAAAITLSTKAVPAIWHLFVSDSQREEKRFDTLLEWNRQYTASIEKLLTEMSMKLTRQNDVLERIERHALLNQCPPTPREDGKPS